MIHKQLWEIGTGLAVLLIALLALAIDGRPDIAPGTAGPQEFSAVRAFRHVQTLASGPRTIGSAAHARARTYLTRELRNLGLSVTIQEGVAAIPVNKPTVGRIHNIVGRLPGTGREPGTLMLAAHYDSSPYGPGAADDAAGVAALLEGLRALRASPPLRNNLIVLLTDGEEMGLLGSRLFVERFPLQDIDLIFNFEARGTGGPVLLFETSPGNRKIVSAFDHSVSEPMGTSIADLFYSLIPNDTDFTIFERSGLPGLNFAFIRGLPFYHTALDRPENLDLRSLQQMGNYALDLTREFGMKDLSTIAAPGDRVYGNLAGGMFVSYPVSWVVWLNLLGVLAIAAALLACRRELQGALSWEAMGVVVLSLFAALLVVSLAIQAWKMLDPTRRWLAWEQQPYNAAGWMLALIGLGLLAQALTLRMAAGRYQKNALVLAAILVCGVPLFLAGMLYPKTHILTFWPVLCSFGLFFLVLKYRSATILAILWTVLALLLSSPTLMLEQAALQSYEVLGLTAAPLAYLAVGLHFLLLLPVLATLVLETRLWLGLSLAAIVAGVLLALVQVGFSPEQPRANHLFYVQDETEQTGWWLSSDPVPDDWTRRMLGTSPVRGRLDALLPVTAEQYLLNSVDSAGLAPPVLEMKRLEGDGDSWEMEATIRSPRGASNVLFFLNGSDFQLEEATAGGVTLTLPPESSRDPWGFLFLGLPSEGLQVTLRGRAGEPPKQFRLIDHSWGLPESRNGLSAPPPRPADTVAKPWPYWFQDATLVSQLVEF